MTLEEFNKDLNIAGDIFINSLGAAYESYKEELNSLFEVAKEANLDDEILVLLVKEQVRKLEVKAEALKSI